MGQAKPALVMADYFDGPYKKLPRNTEECEKMIRYVETGGRSEYPRLPSNRDMVRS